MDDRAMLDEINRMAHEEHALYEQSRADMGLGEAGHQRLRELEQSLDQCWDLLRQRRARRDAGLSPDQVNVRSRAVVQGYLQ